MSAAAVVLGLPAGPMAVAMADDRAAFDAFVRARLPELLRFGRALTGSEESAADLVQDALERTLLQWPHLQLRDQPEGYVRRIMINRNISIWRRRRHERVTDEVPDRGGHDSHPDSELWQAIRELPPRQRAVIALRYYEDLTEVEVGVVMGCSVGTVKSQTAKALTKLRARSNSFSDRPLVRRGGVA